MSSRMILRIIVVALVLVGISGYALYESRNLLRGPIIVIEEPTNGTTITSPVANVKGQAKNIVRINMNDREISINESGQFQEKFVLSKGSNVIKISGVDRFGGKEEKFVEIFYTGKSETLVKR